MNVQQFSSMLGESEVTAPVTRSEQLQVSAVPTLKVMVKGFNAMEHRLLNGTVLLSQRRQPRLDLSSDEGHTADVVMIDAADAEAMRWAKQQPWLKQKVVIWVDAASTEQGHITLRRPVQWTSLPIILARALEQAPRQPTDALHAAPNSSSAHSVPNTQTAQTAHSATTQSSTSSRHSVLVVDDSLAVRALMRSMLEARGFTVTDADSAEAGIDASAAEHYACILMDVLMPGIDGYEACRRIKTRSRNGSGPAIVMLTSKSSPFDRIRGKMAGCDAYLTKPVDAKNLYDVLLRYFPATPSVSASPPAFPQAAVASAPRTWTPGLAVRSVN
jgi:two-component system cell cycle response regulator